MAKKPRNQRGRQTKNPNIPGPDYGVEDKHGKSMLAKHHSAPKVWDWDPETGKQVLHRKNVTQRVVDRYFHKGLINSRQHKAAERLMKQMEMAGFHSVVSVNLLGSMVAGTGSPAWGIPLSEASAESRRKVRVIFAELGFTIGNILIALIQDDRDVLEDMVPIKNAPQKRAALVGMVKVALDALADHYGLTHKD